MGTFESGYWKSDILAFHPMELCHLKLNDLFKAKTLIILTSGQIFISCQFLGYRFLNDANLLKFLVNLFKLLLTYFLMRRDLHVRY
jgi:hypothetical protein